VRRRERRMSPEDFEKALAYPQSAFGTPERVLAAAGLTREQKIEVLRRWEYHATEEAVAVEEGMKGEEPDFLRRILLALGELTGPLDLERTGPTKQHGLS